MTAKGQVSRRQAPSVALAHPTAHAVHAPQLLDGLVDAAERALPAVAEQLRLEAVAHELTRDLIDALCARSRARADDTRHTQPAEQPADALLERPAARQRPRAPVGPPDGPPPGLAVGVDGPRAI